MPIKTKQNSRKLTKLSSSTNIWTDLQLIINHLQTDKLHNTANFKILDVNVNGQTLATSIIVTPYQFEN